MFSLIINRVFPWYAVIILTAVPVVSSRLVTLFVLHNLKRLADINILKHTVQGKQLRVWVGIIQWNIYTEVVIYLIFSIGVAGTPCPLSTVGYFSSAEG